MNPMRIVGFGLLAACLAAAALVFSCHSHDEPSGPPGAVAGALDAHCGSKVVKVNAGLCAAAGADAGADGSTLGSKSFVAPLHGDTPVDPNTRFNAEADDDDCKYRVKWTSSAVAQGRDVSFEVTLTAKDGGGPVRGAPVRLEVFLNDTHPAPNTSQTSSEKSPGVYAAGPIRFDQPGRWTVRFHFNEQCADTAESPHGHVAFFVQVP
jgi:hypothetical protein